MLSRKHIFKLATKVIITISLLALVFSRINMKQMADCLESAHWMFLIPLWLLTIMLFWAGSLKMLLILKKQCCNVNITTILGASLITSLYAMIMPGLLSTSVKWYILKKNTGKGTNVLSSMAYNQFTEIFIMMLLILVATMIVNPVSLFVDIKNQWLLPVISAILLTILILMIVILYNLLTTGKISELLNFLLTPFPPTFRQKATRLLTQTATFHFAGFRFHLLMAMFTITINLIGGFLRFALAAKAANISVPLPVLLWLSAVIYILGRIPISIANLGVRETMLVTFLVPCGVEPSAALLMSIILFSTAVLMAVIGAICQLKGVAAYVIAKRLN